MQKSLKKMEQAADVYAAGKLKELRDNGKTIDSDTYIIKGLLYLLMNVLDGRSLEAAAAAELYFWKDPMLLGSFDDHRQKGIGYVAAALRKSAGELLQQTKTAG